MTPERWHRIEDVYHAALERSAVERAAFVGEICRGDAELRREVESLLASHNRADHFLEQPLAAEAARLITGRETSSLIGRRIGRYQITARLGAGGMGEVFLAEDTKLGRQVALKVLPARFTADEQRVRRFILEARAASALNHPNILTIYEIEEFESTHFIATELVEGETLRRRIARGPVPPDEAMEIAVQVSSALSAAHAAGIVHRDIKPENLMTRADGYVKVLDFGLAKLTGQAKVVSEGSTLVETQMGLVMGTARYMSPEQARGYKVDARTDIFSLGVVCYEMITGRPPFEGVTINDVIASVLQTEPPPVSHYVPDVPPELDRIIIKALVKDREDRYQTIKDLIVDLRRLRQHLDGDRRNLGTVRMEPEAAATATLKLPTSRRWMFMLTPVLLLALIVGGYFIRGRQPPPLPVMTPTSKLTTLAILPFRMLNASEEMNFLGVGIPDAIITRLANVRQIRLRPTSAILRYENKEVNLQEVGQSLGCDYVATGTVQQAGEQFRVNVQLTRTNDGTSLWGKHYDRPRADLLNLQDAIAEQVAAALQIKMSADEQARAYRRYTDNVAAYESYLRGRSQLVRYTKQSTLAAIEAFEDAQRNDPDYVLAHAGLAMASAVMRIRFAPESEVESWSERAKSEANRALQLDPNLAEAHEALAAVYRNTEFDWERTLDESQRALELNPNLEQPHYYRAGAFYHLGLFELIEAEVRAGMEINPSNRVEPLRTSGNGALFSGNFKEAARLLEEAQSISDGPVTDWYLAHAYYYLGERQRAEKLLAELRGSAQAEQRAKATLASFLAARGDRVQAAALLRKVAEGTYMDHHVAYATGVAYTQLGDYANARQWLRRAVDTGLPCYPWYEHDPLLEPIRSGDPEFKTFLAELKKSWEAAKARYTQ